MGSGMSVRRVAATIFRPILNFNARERAHKSLDKVRPSAPRYPTEEKIRQMQESTKNSIGDQNRKDENLLDNLKNVYVTSTVKEENPQSSLTNESGVENSSKRRPLPAYRGMIEFHKDDFERPRFMPEGKIGLEDAVNMITSYTSDPEVNTIATLSKMYKLSEAQVESIVKHFTAFQLYVPESGDNTTTKLKKLFIPSWMNDKPPEQIESK